ncbi:MAG: hypothetical protein GC137_00895 [Alphaproteobacteria bacterium]|nr:hypothetical protein [Alphaproteobacteria bacterium]
MLFVQDDVNGSWHASDRNLRGEYPLLVDGQLIGQADKPAAIRLAATVMARKDLLREAHMAYEQSKPTDRTLG